MAASGFGKLAEGGLHSNHCWGRGWPAHGSLHRDVFPRASRLSVARRWHPNNPAVMNDVCPPRLTHDEPVTFLIVRARPAFYSWLGSIRHLNASRDENVRSPRLRTTRGNKVALDKKGLRRRMDCCLSLKFRKESHLDLTSPQHRPVEQHFGAFRIN